MKAVSNTLLAWSQLVRELNLGDDAEVQLERGYDAGKRAWVFDVLVGMRDGTLILESWDAVQRRQLGKEYVALTVGELLEHLEATDHPRGPQSSWTLEAQEPNDSAPLYPIEDIRVEKGVLILRCGLDGRCGRRM